jgi:hypothetical protein
MVKKRLTMMILIIAVAALTVPAFADTLILKNGERVTGYFEGGTARVVKFKGSDGIVKDYDILSVQQVQFGDAATATAAPASQSTSRSLASPGNTLPSSASATSTSPTLRSPADRAAQTTSTTAANSAFTIPTGSKISIQMIDSIDSEVQKVGETFVAILDQPLMSGGLEVVPRGVDVRGRISNINEAGRVAGSAELGLELTHIYVNGIPYALTTSEYEEVAEGRGGQTARRAAGGAAIGAIIGAVAGGGKGAAIGAGVGAGGATAVQVLTKGDKLKIPSETRLEFTLRAPLVVAAR